MRKFLLLLLVAMVSSVSALAQNKALYLNTGTYSSSTSAREYAAKVPSGALNVPDDQGFNGDANYSIGVWFQFQGVANSGKPGNLLTWTSHNYEAQWGAMYFLHDTSGNITLTTNSDNCGGGASFGNVGTATLNAWHYLLVTIDNANTTVRVYIDGTQTFEKTDAVKIGYKWGDGVFSFGGNNWKGYIDEAQFYTEALSAEEAAIAYQNARNVESLNALYTFDASSDNIENQYIASADDYKANHLPYVTTAANLFEDVYGTAPKALAGKYKYTAWWSQPWGFNTQNGLDTEAPTFVDGRTLAAEDVTVTIEEVEGGTITITDGENEYTAGENSLKSDVVYTLNAEAEDGYTFVKLQVTVDGKTTDYTNGSTVMFPANATVSAVFTSAKLTLTVVNETEFGYAIFKGTENVTAALTEFLPGIQYSLSVTADDTKVLTAVKLDGTVLTVNAAGKYTFTIDADATLEIVGYVKPLYTITIEQPEHGTVSVVKGTDTVINDGDQVAEGDILTLNNTADAGYMFQNYLVNGADHSGNTVTINAATTISAVFAEGVEYCEPNKNGATGLTTANTGRTITRLTVNNGASDTNIAGPGSASGRKVYVDRTENIVTVTPGSTVSVSVTGSGEWMRTYVYVDADLNGFQVEDEVWHNQPEGGTTPIACSYTFTAPTKTGMYRVRHKVDWNDHDPCTIREGKSGASAQGDNGEAVIDWTLKVQSDELDEARTITIAANNDELGTVAFTDPASAENTLTTAQRYVGVAATPVATAAFINWTNAAGDVVSSNTEYVYADTEDVELTANFGHTVNYTADPANGSAQFTVNGQPVGDGALVNHGDVLVVTVRPNSGKMLDEIKVNDVALDATDDNVYNITVNENVNVTVSFKDEEFALYILKDGEGEVYVYDSYDEATEGPAGNQYENGDAIPFGGELDFWFVPAEGYTLQQVIVTNGDEENEYDSFTGEDDIYPCGWNDSFTGYIQSVAGNVVLTVVFDQEQNAIDAIGIDLNAADAEYFNLNGVKVASDNLVPGFYIVRQGDKAAKVMIRK